MAVLYANRIEREAGRANAFTIDNVPQRWKYETLDLLAVKGLDGYGQPLTP